MAIAAELNTKGQALAEEIQATAERLRRSTVQVRGRGPGGGSGVIWSPDGLIVTNAHVARGDTATVELSDGRVFEATVTAKDARRDLAALKVDAADLPAAPIGDSDALRVGELVLAVGNPLGLVGALTTGIVHAVGATENVPGPRGDGRQEWVQADVRLAPGNSGGPLADARGRVIGINSMIAGGLGLAVPSNAVRNFLRARGERPYLGVVTQPVLVTLDTARAAGLLLLEVTADGPAERAGLLIGDALIAVDGVPFTAPDDLLGALYNAGPGGTLRLDVIRGGRRASYTVMLGNARDTPTEAEAEAEAAA